MITIRNLVEALRGKLQQDSEMPGQLADADAHLTPDPAEDVLPVNRTGSAFTLVEVVISLALALMVFSGIIYTYTQATYRAEWSGYSLAAQGLAIQQLEQARSAKWDVLDYPVVDEITNISRVTSATLDLPVTGSNYVWATNYTTVSTPAISSSPPVSVHMVRVDTVWPFVWKGQTSYFTNTVADYFAPDR